MASKHVVDYFDFAVSNKSDGIIFYVNAEDGEITKSDDTIYKQSELSQRAFWENTNKLDINDIHYIINETKNRLLLNEISNNAIETLFKKYIPWITEIFDLTLEQVKNLGKRPEDTRKNVYGIKGMTYCRELGIDYDDDIMINPYVKFSIEQFLPPIDLFNIRIGYIGGFQRERATETSYFTHAVNLDINFRWKFIGFRQSLYCGNALYPLYEKQKTTLNLGDPWYNNKLYSRTDIFFYLYNNRFVNCYASFNIHLNELGHFNCQQQIIAQFNLGRVLDKKAPKFKTQLGK
jgi:hypothetical protein